ncbi:MAG: glutathione S-transferase [Acinetobacter sp.]
MNSAKITLHHLPNSRSQRILWLLEELGLNYELQIYDNKNAADVKNTKLKFPTLCLQQNDIVQTLTESSAIAEYLAQHQQQLVLTPHNEHYWHYCFYQHYADASFMPNLALKQVFSQIVQQTPWLLRFVSLAFKAAFNRGYLNSEMKQQLNQLNTHLQQRTWLAGAQFSIADILLWFPLHASQYAYPQFSDYPALSQYLMQIKSRPAFQTALQKGRWSAEEFQRYWQITQ